MIFFVLYNKLQQKGFSRCSDSKLEFQNADLYRIYINV